jgi:hypothetical protein
MNAFVPERAMVPESLHHLLLAHSDAVVLDR